MGTNAGLCEVMIFFFGCNFRPRGTVGQASWLVARAHDPYRTYFCNPFGHGNFSYFIAFRYRNLWTLNPFSCVFVFNRTCWFSKGNWYLIKKQTFALSSTYRSKMTIPYCFGSVQIILSISLERRNFSCFKSVCCSLLLSNLQLTVWRLCFAVRWR